MRGGGGFGKGAPRPPNPPKINFSGAEVKGCTSSNTPCTPTPDSCPTTFPQVTPSSPSSPVSPGAPFGKRFSSVWEPSLSTKLRVNHIRERLPEMAHSWASATDPAQQPLVGGFAAWVLWELLFARSAKDIQAIMASLRTTTSWNVRRSHLLEDGLDLLLRLSKSQLHAELVQVAARRGLGEGSHEGVGRKRFP